MNLYFVTSPYHNERGKYIRAWTHKQAAAKREVRKVKTHSNMSELPRWMVIRVDYEGTDENGRIYCRNRKFRHYITVVK
jgi:hypothetical protein